MSRRRARRQCNPLPLDFGQGVEEISAYSREATSLLGPGEAQGSANLSGSGFVGLGDCMALEPRVWLGG